MTPKVSAPAPSLPKAPPDTPPLSNVHVPLPTEEHRASRSPSQRYAPHTPSPRQRRPCSTERRHTCQRSTMSVFPSRHEQHRTSVPHAPNRRPPPLASATAAPAPPGDATHATAVPIPRPPPPMNNTALPVPRAAHPHPLPPVPPTAAPATLDAATHAIAVPYPRPPPPTNSTVHPVPPAAHTHTPPPAPAHLAWGSAPALQELGHWSRWAEGAGRRQGVH